MSAYSVPFKQVDVFSAVPFKGNPLAVIFDADGLTTEQMQAIANWTQLPETSFICQPTDPAADYLVRIFTRYYEMPFAGHPTLGTAHALIESGYQPKQAGRLIQQCGVGLVEIREQAPGVRAFAAPTATISPLPVSEYAALLQALGCDDIDLSLLPPATVDNGVPWLVVKLASPQACLAVTPDAAKLFPLLQRANAKGVALLAAHRNDSQADFEIRCLIVRENLSIDEDPATGSANAGVASYLLATGQQPGVHYNVRQGTALGRDARISVTYEQPDNPIWIAGAAITVVDGTVQLS